MQYTRDFELVFCLFNTCIVPFVKSQRFWRIHALFVTYYCFVELS